MFFFADVLPVPRSVVIAVHLVVDVGVAGLVLVDRGNTAQQNSNLPNKIVEGVVADVDANHVDTQLSSPLFQDSFLLGKSRVFMQSFQLKIKTV